jgi:large subunit ribosomal protein L18
VNKQKAISKQRRRRRLGVRNNIRGSADRPRLSVFRSQKHISVQVIDDSQGTTLVSAGTRDKQLRDQIVNGKGGNQAAAAVVGTAIAQRALEAGIKQVCFDRGHYRYHGRVAALANAAREAGLAF